jgi:hypothetical protein
VSGSHIGQVEAISKPGRGCPTPAHRGHAPLVYDGVKVGHLNFRSPTEAVRQRPSRVDDSAPCSPCGAEGDYLWR